MNVALSHFGLMEQIDNIAAAGFDCVELRIDEFISFNKEKFHEFCKIVKDSGLNTDVHANPIPLDAYIASPDFDLEECNQLIKEVILRCAELNAKYIVYGNSKARKIPDGPNREDAIKKNQEVISMLCDHASYYKITILLEPLGKSITNFVNTIKEACEQIKNIDHSNLKTMIDYRWYVEDGNSLDDLITYAEIVKHVHIDNPLISFPERRNPSLNDGFDYSPLFNTLKNISYNGIISVEANTFNDFPKDIKESLELLKHYLI